MNLKKISTDSGYANATFYTHTDGTPLVFQRTPDFLRTHYQTSANEQYDVVKAGETCRTLAVKHYNNMPTPYIFDYVIADANGIENPADLTAYIGKEILIPKILQVSLL